MDELKVTLLSEEEFKELDDKSKWNYIQTLIKQIYDYKMMADKNCEDCIYRLQTSRDVNIDLFFDDWRECTNYCDECDVDKLKQMCDVQFQIMNHIANILFELQLKQNRLVQFMYRKDPKGKEILEEMKKAHDEARKKEEESGDMFL